MTAYNNNSHNHFRYFCENLLLPVLSYQKYGHQMDDHQIDNQLLALGCHTVIDYTAFFLNSKRAKKKSYEIGISEES